MAASGNKNLLILHQGALGDFVVAFPALIRLKRHYCRIDAICQSKLGKLAEYLNIVTASFPLEAAAFASLFTDVIDTRIQELMRRYHTILLFSNSKPLENAINRCTAAPVYRISPRPEADRSIHVGRHIKSALIKAGLLPSSSAIDDTRHNSETMIDHKLENYDPSTICIHPGSGSPIKNWPLSNFMTICKALESKGLKPEFILGPAETDLRHDLISMPTVTHFFTDLVKLAAQLRNAGGYIGNDSGVTHLAAYLGLPTVAVFGPSDPIRWHPVGRAVRVARPDVDCVPCFETDPAQCAATDCLTRISPQQVLLNFTEIYPIKSPFE